MTVHVKKLPAELGKSFLEGKLQNFSKRHVLTCYSGNWLSMNVSKTAVGFDTPITPLQQTMTSAHHPEHLYCSRKKWEMQDKPHNMSIEQDMSGGEQCHRKQLVSDSELRLTAHAPE